MICLRSTMLAEREAVDFWHREYEVAMGERDYWKEVAEKYRVGFLRAGMDNLMADVSCFHQACDIPVNRGVPSFPNEAQRRLRTNLLSEEVGEFYVAVDARCLADVADALADIIYICIGTALVYGIPLDRVWVEVQRSNMAKVDPETGKARKREDGKVLKPEGWTPPDIEKALC